MNEADLASQQLLTAWVSAGASVVQALGAVAAIIAAVVLARSSERRASDAEAKADRRALDAERDSVRRAEAAELRADERMNADRLREWDVVVEPVLVQLRATVSYLRAEIARQEQQLQLPSGRSMTFYGPGAEVAQSLKKLASEAIGRAPTKELAALFVTIDQSVSQHEPLEPKADLIQNWVAARRASAAAFSSFEDEIAEMRKAFASRGRSPSPPSG
jgi:hypothetical protein